MSCRLSKLTRLRTSHVALRCRSPLSGKPVTGEPPPLVRDPKMNQLSVVLLVAALAWPTHSEAAEAIVRAVFPAKTISRIVLRAGNANLATVEKVDASASIQISATATGGSRGYHSPDPDWKETPPSDWGLEFVGKVFGSILVISTKNEIQYIHHRYVLERIHLLVPSNIEVVREPRTLSGDGKPNLSPP